MSEQQRQTPLLEEANKPSREIKRRRLLKYFLAAAGTALGLEWQYRIIGKYLDSFPQGSTQRRIGLTDRLTRKWLQDQFSGEQERQVAESWWKFNIAQISAENEQKIVMAKALYAF